MLYLVSFVPMPLHYISKWLAWARSNIFPDVEKDARSKVLLFATAWRSSILATRRSSRPCSRLELAPEVFNHLYQIFSVLFEEEEDWCWKVFDANTSGKIYTDAQGKQTRPGLGECTANLQLRELLFSLEVTMPGTSCQHHEESFTQQSQHHFFLQQFLQLSDFLPDLACPV